MIEWILKLFVRKTNLEKLIAKADEAYNKSHKQYFIMPTKQVFDKDYDKSLRLGIRQMTYVDMINQCVYQTPSGNTNKR